ncbi:helix-turn-helix domain-containing protein [Candidatus Uhrbacteria bacterium]|nr:helix-turn-helix domain-containing protein [Candidatus Uhrbacteria bacterium]
MNVPQDPKATVAAVRVSVSEAARLFGVSSRTIRRAIASGELRYIVVRGRYRILFESLVRWSQRQPTVRRKRDESGIGQWVEQWNIRNPKFSPRAPSEAPEHDA